MYAVVGRQGSDVDMVGDRAYLYLSMKTDVDDNVRTSGFGGSRKATAAAVLTADSVRIVAREDLKISVAGGKSYVVVTRDGIVLEGDLKLGAEAQERIVKESFRSVYDGHFHVAPGTGGPTSGPSVPIEDSCLTARTRAF